VPYEDHLGIDRQREFPDATQARQFRYALKIPRDAKLPYGDPEGFAAHARRHSRDDRSTMPPFGG
jgi:hypothetical protein